MTTPWLRQMTWRRFQYYYRANHFFIGQPSCTFCCNLRRNSQQSQGFHTICRLSHQLHTNSPDDLKVRRNGQCLCKTILLSGKTLCVTSVRKYVMPPPPIKINHSATSADGHQDGVVDSEKHTDDCILEFATKEEDGENIDQVGKVCHIPVMVKEVLHALQPKDGQIIVDMTFGAGGHAKEILNIAPAVRYFASDRDPVAFGFAQELSAEHRSWKLIPLLSRFSEMPVHLHQHGIEPGMVDAFLFDLGASSMQFDSAERGFALSKNGPLDMRMDGSRFPDSPTAADLVNTLEPHDLAHILKKYGEEKKARQIAHAIVEARYAFGNFTTTKQLADVISSVFQSGAFRHDKLFRHSHVATKCFQALRIFVNDELNEIHNGLQVARHFLKPNGRCAVISFHSLEDRIVKRHFNDINIDEDNNLSIHDHYRNANISFDNEAVREEFLTKPWCPLSRKVIEPSESECLCNPRARSAKLRAAVKQDVVC